MTKLYLGDCVDGMRRIADPVLDLTVVSPPYGSLRKFGGHRFTQDTFEGVAGELWRLTKPGGIVCWQEGDEIMKSGPYEGSYSCDSWRHALHFQDLGFLVWDVIVTGSTGIRNP